MQQEQPQEQNLNVNWLVLDTIRRLRDSKAAGQKEQYFALTDFGLKLVQSYFPLDVRKMLDQDYTMFRVEAKRIRETEKAEVSRKKLIDELNYEFAEAHDGRLMSALARMGIIKNQEDGVIDFSELSMDQYAEIIQNRRKGVIKALQEAKGEGADGLPAK
jgi:hypothetical protein